MQYVTTYSSPLGVMLLAADEAGLTGAWFEGAKYYAKGLDPLHQKVEVSVLTQAKRWLDVYFAGKNPGETPEIHLMGSEFQIAVWELLRRIPYGAVTTYGELAQKIAAQRNLTRMSAQAVGGAVGRNPISILVPCHRVLGSSGSLTGYAGGLERKSRLLTLEGAG